MNSLKKLVAFILFTCCLLPVCAQQDAGAATLNNIQNVPSFKIFVAPDSTEFNSGNLKKNKPFILIFFNPDCDHCQKETKELLAYKEELKNIQIVMVSTSPYHVIKDFYQDYNMSSMPNVQMGQDVNYALGSKYQLRTYPAIFIYDATGKLAKAFVGNAGVPMILAAIK